MEGLGVRLVTGRVVGGEREGKVKMIPSFLDRYLRGGTSEENWALAMAGDMMGSEDEFLYILRHPDVTNVVLCTCPVLGREVWPGDANLGVMCMEGTIGACDKIVETAWRERGRGSRPTTNILPLNRTIEYSVTVPWTTERDLERNRDLTGITRGYQEGCVALHSG